MQVQWSCTPINSVMASTIAKKCHCVAGPPHHHPPTEKKENA